MTIDEAIKHAEEVAEEKEKEGKLLCQSESASMGCLTCAEEHRQLAEWLKDYKRLKEQEPSVSENPNNCEMRDATPEEQEAIAKYIKSISKPTGIEFDIDIDKKVESYGKLLKHPVVKHIMNEEQEQLNFVQPPVTLTVGGDCISRQQAKAYLYDRIDRLKDNELYDIFSVIIDGMVNELSPVKPQTGHWILQPSNKEHGERDFIWWKCSECGQVIYSETEKDRREYHAFCGRCGARMESEQNG